MYRKQKGYGLGGVFRGSSYQKGSGLGGIFRGAPYQKGYGLGDVMVKFINWMKPFFSKAKENLMPVLKASAKNIGQEVINSASNIAKDLIDGKNLKESSEKNINETIDKLTKTQAGSGTINKRRLERKNNIRRKKRILDIFD